MVKKKKPKLRIKKSKGRTLRKSAMTRKAKKTPKKPKVGLKRSVGKEAALEKIGEVTHYFPKVKAAAVMILKDSLKTGDKIYVKGHTTDFKQNVTSMQLDHVPIEEGKKAQEIGLLVKSRVRIGDSVYRM